MMIAAWTDDADVVYEGRHFNARGVRMLPRPVAQPHPPIWMGGNSTRAIRRAVERCQGWAPFPSAGIERTTRTATISGIDDLAARIDLARTIAEETGRTEPFDVCFSAGDAGDPSKSIDERRDHLGRLAEIGVTWVAVSFPDKTRAAYIDSLNQFATDLL